MMSNPQPIKDTGYLFKYVDHENDRANSSFWFGDKDVFRLWKIQHGADVLKGDFVSLAEGFSPNKQTPLMTSSGKPNRRKGKEFSLSAPKSFGIAFEAADETTKQLLEQCDRIAATAALSFVQEAIFTTKDAQGLKRAPHSILAAVFTHRTNRDEEIHWHKHIELLNVCVDKQGKFRGLDFKTLFTHKKHIGAIYRQVLANELMKCGFEIERDRFSWRISAIPAAVDAAFSKRTQHIDKLEQERNIDGQLSSGQRAALRQGIAISTRKAKSSTAISSLSLKWRDTLSKNFGIDEQFVSNLIQPNVGGLLAMPTLQEVTGHMTRHGRVTTVRAKEFPILLLELKAIYPAMDLAQVTQQMTDQGIIYTQGANIEFNRSYLEKYFQQRMRKTGRTASRRGLFPLQRITPKGQLNSGSSNVFAPSGSCPVRVASAPAAKHGVEGGSEVMNMPSEISVASDRPAQEAMRIKAFNLEQKARLLSFRALVARKVSERDKLFAQAAALLQASQDLLNESARPNRATSIEVS